MVYGITDLVGFARHLLSESGLAGEGVRKRESEEARKGGSEEASGI